MSKAQHTPSPWRYCAPIGAFGHEVIADAGLVCQTNHNPARQMQAKADAHLIAAAPELLEALEHCLMEHGGFTIRGETERVARAAIAKAKGE